MKKNFAQKIEQERSETTAQNRKCVKLQESVHDLQVENEKLLKKIEQKLGAVDEWVKFIDNTKTFLDARQEARIVRAQGLIRGWLARRRLRKVSVSLAASLAASEHAARLHALRCRSAPYRVRRGRDDAAVQHSPTTCRPLWR